MSMYDLAIITADGPDGGCRCCGVLPGTEHDRQCPIREAAMLGLMSNNRIFPRIEAAHAGVCMGANLCAVYNDALRREAYLLEAHPDCPVHGDDASGPRTAFPVRGQGVRVPSISESNVDTVNHPAHYGGDTTYEVIKVLTAWDLPPLLWQVVKYIARAGKKGDRLEDLKKAQFYLNYEIELAEGKREV